MRCTLKLLLQCDCFQHVCGLGSCFFTDLG